MTPSTTAPIGSLAIVLHSHLPWVLGHGRWPVGEEWLYAAWAQSYVPVVEALNRLAIDGHRDVLTLGVSPVLANALDDDAGLRGVRQWVADWQLRAHALAGHPDPHLRQQATYEHRSATIVEHALATTWSAGGSTPLRSLADAGVVELLGGPATHSFAPLLPDWFVQTALDAGLDDVAVRWGDRPRGIWAPECGYRPGLETQYQQAYVSHLVLDGPTLLGAGAATSAGHPLGDSNVVAFGRDLDVSYRVWSPRRGYPGGQWYRDFHAWDVASGLQPYRVTNRLSDQKLPYEPRRAHAAVDADAADFVSVVRRRLESHRERDGRPGLVVVAYDTELFGHWWHEGPHWLEAVIQAMTLAGVTLTTLSGAISSGLVGDPVSPGSGSWGSGKDWRVWEGTLAADNADLVDRVHKSLTRLDSSGPASAVGHNELLRQALLATASDWAFMAAKDSAAQYALDRHATHHRAADRIMAQLERNTWQPGAATADDRLLPVVDARHAADLVGC